MSIALYIIAACTYIAANLIGLRMLSAAGDRWTLVTKPFATPGQITRFIAFVVLLSITAWAIVAGRSIGSDQSPF